MFYGWKLSALGTAGNFLIQGSIIYVMNAFLTPLTVLHGWTRADISLAMSVAAICGGLSMPVLSSLSLRFSLRLLMTGGALVGGLSLCLLGVTDNFWTFTCLYSLAWMSGQAFGGVIANVLMNQWFYRYQGRAFGFCNIGVSTAGVIMPFCMLLLIEWSGVQAAWFVYGGLVLVFVPVCWLMIKDRPEDMGLYIDNRPEPMSENKKQDSQTVIPVRQALKIPSVYLTGLIFGLSLMVGSAIMSQLKPRLEDVGMGSYEAMSVMCLTALFAAAAKYFWGCLCDRWNPVLVARALMLSDTLALSLIFLPPNPLTACLFAVFFGISVGGAWSVLPAVVAFHFGREYFVSIYRVVAPFILLKAAGYPVLGYSYVLTGSYNTAFLLFIIILLFCFFLSLGLKTTPKSARMEKAATPQRTDFIFHRVFHGKK